MDKQQERKWLYAEGPSRVNDDKLKEAVHNTLGIIEKKLLTKNDRYSISEIITTSSEIMHEERIRHEITYMAIKLLVYKYSGSKTIAKTILITIIGIMQSESLNGVSEVSRLARNENDLIINSYIDLFEEKEATLSTSETRKKIEEVTRKIEKLNREGDKNGLIHPMEYTLIFNLIKIVQQKLLTKTNDWKYIEEILERISQSTKRTSKCAEKDLIIDKHVKHSLQDRLNKIINRDKNKITRFCGGTLYSWRNLIELTNFKGSLTKRKNINEAEKSKDIVLTTGPGTTGKFDLYLYLAYHRESILKQGKSFELYFDDKESAEGILSLLKLEKQISMVEGIRHEKGNQIGFLEQYEFEQYIKVA